MTQMLSFWSAALCSRYILICYVSFKLNLISNAPPTTPISSCSYAYETDWLK